MSFQEHRRNRRERGKGGKGERGKGEKGERKVLRGLKSFSSVPDDRYRFEWTIKGKIRWVFLEPIC